MTFLNFLWIFLQFLNLFFLPREMKFHPNWKNRKYHIESPLMGLKAYLLLISSCAITQSEGPFSRSFSHYPSYCFSCSRRFFTLSRKNGKGGRHCGEFFATGSRAERKNNRRKNDAQFDESGDGIKGTRINVFSASSSILFAFYESVRMFWN